jgi:hypothetical protein
MRGRMASMRFKLAELFWLTFWLAVLISLWRLITSVKYEASTEKHIEQMFIATVSMLTVAAVGALYGRAKIGAVIGVIVAMLLLAYISPLVSFY